MSLDAIVSALIADGRLIKFPSPVVDDDDAPRTMLVTPAIYDAAMKSFEDSEDAPRLAELRATLEAFVEHGSFSVAEDPMNKDPDSLLARVSPVEDEFWSVRVTDPKDTPGIRMLGAFYGRDDFIALTWDYRENIGENFDEEVMEVRRSWKELFGSLKPHSGVSLHDYLTNYIIA